VLSALANITANRHVQNVNSVNLVHAHIAPLPKKISPTCI